MNYEIEIKDIEPVTVAIMGYKGLVTGAAKQFPHVFKAIKGNPNKYITPIRHLGIRLSGLVENESYQASFFDDMNKEKLRKLDNTIDEIRMRFGSKAIMRAGFINSPIRPMTVGVAEDYPLMSSML